jgi:hypothetical protein
MGRPNAVDYRELGECPGMISSCICAGASRTGFESKRLRAFLNGGTLTPSRFIRSFGVAPYYERGCAQEVDALKSLCRGRVPGCRERLCSVRATWVGLNSDRLSLSLRTLPSQHFRISVTPCECGRLASERGESAVHIAHSGRNEVSRIDIAQRNCRCLHS